MAKCKFYEEDTKRREEAEAYGEIYEETCDFCKHLHSGYTGLYGEYITSCECPDPECSGFIKVEFDEEFVK